MSTDAYSNDVYLAACDSDRAAWAPLVEPYQIITVADDPRGENACTECDEGEMVSLGNWRNPAADQVECSVCGHRE